MVKVGYISGSRKWLVNQRIKLTVFAFFLQQFLMGRLHSPNFIRFLRRLLFFLSKMKENKYIRIGNRIKINLYVPAFPTKAFFNACSKVNEFEKKMPCVTALISITSSCRFKCEHCYQRFDTGKDLDLDKLVNSVQQMQNTGIAFFNIEGGEPFLVFNRLKAVCQAIDNRSEILINSTGDGMTREKLEILRENKNLIGIMFSLHTHEPDQLNRFMARNDAWDILEKGVQLCHETGIAVMFNSCMLKADFSNGNFEKIMERAKSFNGALLQLIKPKPAGGWLESGADRFDKNDERMVKEKVDEYNLTASKKNYPSISCMIHEESKEMFGCTAGGTDRFYLNAKGDVQPCEFLNISFGNIQQEGFDTIFERMREQFQEPGDCMLCEKYSAQILKQYRDNGLASLPLSAELSKQIYQDWDRGTPADFYHKVKKL